jgi:hypothetical protein
MMSLNLPKPSTWGPFITSRSSNTRAALATGTPFDESNDLTPSILFHLFHVNEPMEHLESIEIEFNLEEDSINKSFLGKTVTHHAWALLDADLSNASHFPHLIQFEIDIEIILPYRVPSIHSNEITRLLDSSFPRVLATETISFCPTTRLLINYDPMEEPSLVYW